MLLLVKQAIIAPNKLIGSQHYERLSPSQPRSKIHHSKKTLNYFKMIPILVESFRNLH